tara:strand:- start:308 stop:967 length:660 start_codon:yes stop_codon:yes gene_type:complete
MTRKNVVLCTTPRSGSTWFLLDQVEKHPGMINHHESLRTLSHGYEAFPKSDAQRKAQFKQVLRDWNNPEISNCVKVFPLMLTEQRSPWRKQSFFKDLLDNADQVYYLMRRNFPAQVMSSAVAFYRTQMGEPNFHGNWEEDYHMPDNYDTRKLLVNCERQMYSQNYQLLQMWHNTETDAPTELLFLEDIDQSGKYHRPVRWERPPIIQEVDWEPLFQREL